jgi:hypothetical protein
LKHLAGRRNTNVTLDYQLRRGDVEKAFAECDHVFEHTFRTQQVLHVPLESHASLAEPGHESLIIHTSTQTPSFVRMEIARLLGWPENRVSVRVPFLGGGYGAKVYVKMEALAAALALLVKRPVKIAPHHGGAILHHQQTRPRRSASKAVLPRTAGSRHAPAMCGGTAALMRTSARVSHRRQDSRRQVRMTSSMCGSIPRKCIRTGRRRAPCAGFGVPQLVWAYESHTDMILARA